MDNASRRSARADGDGYLVGVMRTRVEQRDRDEFDRMVESASSRFEERLTQDLGLRCMFPAERGTKGVIDRMSENDNPSPQTQTARQT